MSERNRGFTFSDHALERMAEMGLGRHDVLPVILDAEVSWTSARDGRTTYQRGGLAAVTQAQVVVTVLYRLQDQWTRSQPPLLLSHP